MSIPYETTGRRNQKSRTRTALVEAARRLILRGVTPTVEQAAAEASISRTTAYRYFPSQRSLLVAAYPYLGASSLVRVPDSPDPAVRLQAVVEAHTNQILELEFQLRTMLRLSLDGAEGRQEQLLLRRGRAIGWIEEALEPLREELGDDGLRRLAVAIRSVEGIEAFVWLTDVARLPREEAVEVMRWSAQALLHAALDGTPPPRGAS
jgi:AcrR family transcriptional regulator